MPDVAAIIEDLSTRWMNAWVELDRRTLEAMMAPDFALIVSAMPSRQMERAVWLETCSRYRCSEFRYRDVQVRQLADDIAVMSSIAEQSAELEGVDRSGQFWLTDIWRRNTAGAWQVCARYSSAPEAAAQSAAALDALNDRRRGIGD